MPPSSTGGGSAGTTVLLRAVAALGASGKTPRDFSSLSNASTPRGPRLIRDPAQALPSMTGTRRGVSVLSLDMYLSEAGIPREGSTRARTTVLPWPLRGVSPTVTGKSGLARGRRAAGDVQRRQNDRVVHCHHEPPLPDPLQQMRVSPLESVDVDAVMLSSIGEGDLPGQLEWRETDDAGRKCEEFRFHAAH